MLGSGYVAPIVEVAPSGGTPYDAAYIQRQNPAAWFRFGMGITVATGVSQWNDQTANARHLTQGTAGAQPALQADNSILFDGVDDFLKCTGFTLNQPETVYLLFKQVTWTLSDYLFDGNTLNSGALYQDPGTPTISLFAGSSAPTSAALAANTYGVVACLFNGASSVIQVNTTTSALGNPGAANMGGFTLGSRGDSAANFGNIQVKEVIIFPQAHNESVRAGVIQYLAAVGGIAL